MTELLTYIKNTFTVNKLLATVAAGSAVAVLATEELTTALYVSLVMSVMTVASAACAALSGKVTGKSGVKVIYIAVSAFVAVTATSVLATAENATPDNFALIMAISCASSVMINGCPEREDGIVKPIVSSVITAIFYAILLIFVAFARELAGGGRILGEQVTTHDLPFALLPAGGFIALGIVAAVIKAVYAFVGKRIEKKKNAVAEKEEENADA